MAQAAAAAAAATAAAPPPAAAATAAAAPPAASISKKQQRHCCAHLQRLLWLKTAAKSTPNRSSLPGVVTSSIQVAGFKSSGIDCTPGIASK